MYRLAASVVVTSLVAVWASNWAAAQSEAKSMADQLAYGKHLSQECTTCHRLDGGGTNIPSIVGLKHDYFVTTLVFYKTGARDNPAMNSVAQMLTEEQIEALAAYFAQITPQKKAISRSNKK